VREGGQCPRERQWEVVLVGRLCPLGKIHHGVFEGEKDPGVYFQGEVEVEWPVAGFLGVQVDLPRLAKRVSLDEMALVVHVETVVDGMVL